MRTLLLAGLVACGGSTTSSPSSVSNTTPPSSPPMAQVEATEPGPNACTDATGPELSKCAINVMEHHTNKMCSCKDKACADGVNEGLSKWGMAMAKSPRATSEKPDPELAKRSADIMTRYTECMTKLMMDASPPADPCGGGENPCG